MDTNEIVTIEKNISNYISLCLEGDESIANSELFDFYIPKGCKELDWPINTYVEVKYRLIYDTISKIRDLFDKSNANKLIVIVITEDNKIGKIFEASNYISGRNIEIVYYKDLIKKVPVKKSVSANIEDRHKNTLHIDVIDKAKKAFQNGKVSLFLGAGVSASAGVVKWDGLLEQLCIKREIPKIDCDIETVIKGRYIVDDYYNTQEQSSSSCFYEDIRNILYTNIRASSLIESIAKIAQHDNVESVISYNYDNLVEQEISKTKRCYPVYDKSRPVEGNSLRIYHVHGFIPQSGSYSPIVLGEREYHKIYQEAYNWGNVEQLHALCRNVCFFIGLSMNDPNLRRLMDIAIDGSEVELVHYAFLRRIEYNVPFMEKIMRGFGVNCVWYDNYDDLPLLLDCLIPKN